MKIYLDDRREAPEDYVVCRSYDEFISLVKQEMPEEVSFDHDLELPHYQGSYSNGKTGYDALLFLLSWCIMKEVSLPTIKLHSANPEGIERMRILLRTMTTLHNV
jgi:hypothetical protein